jgi:hypothetical protein
MTAAELLNGIQFSPSAKVIQTITNTEKTLKNPIKDTSLSTINQSY